VGRRPPDRGFRPQAVLSRTWRPMRRPNTRGGRHRGLFFAVRCLARWLGCSNDPASRSRSVRRKVPIVDGLSPVTSLLARLGRTRQIDSTRKPRARIRSMNPQTSATSKRSLPPQVPLQRGRGSDLMCGHPRRRPFSGVGRKVREELEYDGIEYAALPVKPVVFTARDVAHHAEAVRSQYSWQVSQ
jgi:hypothetical protein